MNWVLMLYALSIPAAIAISGFLAGYSWRHRSVTGGAAFMWLCILVGLLALMEGFSILAPNPKWAHFWFDLRFISLATLSVVWLTFVLQFTGQASWLAPRRLAGLFILPMITQGMIWINPLHGFWVIKPVAFHPAGPFFIAQTSVRVPGFWMWVHFAYSYALVLAGITVMAVTLVRLDPRSRGKFLTIGLGTLIMALASALPAFRIFPEFTVNPLIPVITAGLLIISWGAFHHWFLRSPLTFRAEKDLPVALITLFVLLSAGIIVTGYVYYRNYEKNYRMEVEHTLSSIAELKVSEIVQWRKERLADAFVLHKNSAFAQLARRAMDPKGDAAAKKHLLIWLGQVRTAYQYKNVILLDPAGRILYAAGNPQPRVCDEIRKRLSDFRQIHRIVFLDLHREIPGPSATLSLIVPIEEKGRFLGVVALVIDPAVYLYPMISRWPTPGKTAETLLVRREGNEVVFLNDLKFQKDTALKLRFPLSRSDLPAARAVLGNEGVMEGIDYRGQPVVAALRAVPDSPWFMVARMDRSEIYAPVRKSLLFMILTVCLIIFGAAAVIWLVRQRQRNAFYRRELEAAGALQASEEKFRKAFMTSPDAVAIARLADGLLVSVNTGFLSITGYRVLEIAGKTVPEIHIWKNDPDRKHLIDQLQRDGIVNNFEAPFLNKKGETVYGLVSASIIDLDGQPHILTIVRDISERKRMEDKLRESEDKFRYMFDNSTVGKSITHPGGPVNVNKAFADLLGYTPEELNHRRWQDITHPDDVTLTQQAIDGILSGRNTSARFIKRFIHKDGSVVWIDLSSSLRRDADGKPLYFMSTLVDMTGQIKAQEALRKLNEELDMRVAQRTAELAAKNTELERLNRVFVDRELRMRELKDRIAELENK